MGPCKAWRHVEGRERKWALLGSWRYRDKVTLRWQLVQGSEVNWFELKPGGMMVETRINMLRQPEDRREAKLQL